jgi:Taurine catabolism dioxygenase TauD, TfdA family.
MQKFYDTPVYNTLTDENIEDLLIVESADLDIAQITEALAKNKLVLIRSFSFEKSSVLFRELVDHYNLTDSYEIQMQFVVHMMMDRQPIDDVAVTVNDRGPYQIIQAHSEGDSTSQLDLFGLHCKKNAETGGENILSLINQSADYSKLVAKEKAIVGENLTEDDIYAIRGNHLDAKEVISTCPTPHKVLSESPKGKVVVRNVPVKASKSIIANKELVTYWDNVTVHDHSFHQHHYDLLKELNILNENTVNSDYKAYMHIEADSDWAPADTRSGEVEETSNLFDRHIVHKMQADDFLLFNNRAWTHAVNNWVDGEQRDMLAMYA